MAGAGILATTLTTPATRVLSVFVGGLDVTGDVKWDSLVVTDSGTNAKGTADLRIERTPSAVTEITDQALVRVYDHSASGGEVFRGFVRARRPSQDPMYAYLELIADDLTTLLDDTIIDIELRQPETAQARLGYLWGKYGGAYLSGDFSYVQSVGSTLPMQRFDTLTLRNGIEMTLAQASSTADYYVDMLGKLHVFETESNDAPFNIDADAPGGGEIAPHDLDLEHDSQTYYNRVFVKGASSEASDFFQDGAAIAAANGLVRTGVIQGPDITTIEMAQALADTYLQRVKAAKPRGVFTATSPDDGWRAGQNVEVTSASHGLTDEPYRIARVTTRVLTPGPDLKRHYTVEFGGAQAGAGIDGVTPLIAGSTAGIYTLDQIGNSLVAAAAVAESGAIGPVMRRWITSGIYNSDFIAPPPGPDAPIDDDTNPLPYWSISLGSNPENNVISSVAADVVSGRRLRCEIIGGTGTASKQLGQLSPIHGSAGGTTPYVVRAVVTNAGGTTSANLSAQLAVIYHQVGQLDGSGNLAYPSTGTTGSDTITLSALGAGGTAVLVAVPNAGVIPNDAYFMSVQLQLTRASSTDLGAIEWSDVWVDRDDILKGAVATRSGTQTITDSTWTPIQYNGTDLADPLGFHDPSTNNTRFTVPMGLGGLYQLVGQCYMGNTTQEVWAGWAKNGAAVANQDLGTDRETPDGETVRFQVTTYMELADGDYVEFLVLHVHGADLTYGSGGWAAIHYLGEAG